MENCPSLSLSLKKSKAQEESLYILKKSLKIEKKMEWRIFSPLVAKKKKIKDGNVRFPFISRLALFLFACLYKSVNWITDVQS